MARKNKIQVLNDKLIDTLMSDLNDPDKCTPGLYQVVRGVITDNQAAVDNFDMAAIEEAAEVIDMPFKFGN